MNNEIKKQIERSEKFLAKVKKAEEDAKNRQLIFRFLQLTGQSFKNKNRELAKAILESCAWSLEMALEIHTIYNNE